MLAHKLHVGVEDESVDHVSTGSTLLHDPRWYVAQTQPRAEILATQHLVRQGFNSFFPRFRKLRRHARRVDEILAPVFPGYIFVCFDRDRDQWRSINSTLGVSRLVGNTSNRPQPVPDAAMAAIQSRCEGDLMTDLVPTFRPGQQVRLLTGAFADQLAEIERLDDRGRVRVLLNILGGISSVDMSISAIGPV